MKKLCDLCYGIVGMGLMGGSIAKAIRGNVLGVPSARGHILGYDINAASLELAASQHTVDAVYDARSVDKMLAQCDFVYVCLYPHATVQFLKDHRDAFKPGAIVSDISGVKALIFASLADIVRDDVDFIPGHPMAGSEREGFAHSSGDIFRNHNYILMPLAQTKPENLALFRSLISAMGFSRIVETDARVHDHKIAFTSQLCHVIASALVDSAEDTEVTAFGGGSFEDLTRIAMINAPLWTELFIANREELLLHIDKFMHSLESLRGYIEESRPADIEAYLENVRTRRVAMNTIVSKAGR
ncbi:MAG TPA: prephenate dehydrogenase/arogenate dehydrogenase family protein [Treponema sp.]|nr:prephenate dehydrogenase/arogenate dehydrogenase family protein [Treponema sp.]